MTAARIDGATPVRRRRVYYLSGFDPRGARFYHQLYRSEAAQQARVNRCEYEVGRRQKAGEHVTAWNITARCGEQHTQTRFAFLGWDDLVREHWPASMASVIAALPGFYASFAACGGLAKTLRCAPRTFWSMVSPLLYAGLVLLAAGLAALGSAWLVQRWTQLSVIGLVLGLAVGAGMLKLGLVGAERLRLFWLMRILLFVLQWGRSPPPALAQRWAEFAAVIDADLDGDPADEVLVVGHSVGVMAAVAVAERWLARQSAATPRVTPVRLMTLGSVIPLLGFIPEAGWFRAQVAAVGASDMAWIDFTAPSDPLCYALVDPFGACGLARPPGSGHHIKSARFDKMFSAATYRQIRQDAFRVHFQYLMATEQVVANDFCRLTAGAEFLVESLAVSSPAA